MAFQPLTQQLDTNQSSSTGFHPLTVQSQTTTGFHPLTTKPIYSSKPTTPTTQPVTPTPVQQQPNPVLKALKTLGDISVKIAPKIPEAHFADKMNFFTPLGFAANLAQGIINTPAEALKGNADIVTHIKKNDSTSKQVAGDLAAAVQLPLMLLTGGEGKAVVQTGEQIAKAALEKTAGSVIKNVAVKGAKMLATESLTGAAYGALGGLQSGKDIQNNKDYFQNFIKNVGIGAVAGPIVGTATHIVAGATSHIVVPLAKGLSEKLGAVFVKNVDKNPAIDHIQVDPKVAQSVVLGNDLEKTPVGKEIIKQAVVAQQTGEHVAITPTADGKFTLPDGSKVDVATAKPYVVPDPIDSFEKNIQDYRSYGGYSEGKNTGNAALRDISNASEIPAVKEYTQQQVTHAINEGKLQLDENGDVTLYRGGGQSSKNNLISASYDKNVAQEFADSAQKHGETVPLHEIKVKPEDIKAFIGKAEGEVLVSNDALKPKDTQIESPVGKLLLNKESLLSKNTYKLPEIIKNEDLFRKYPDLREFNIHFSEMDKGHAGLVNGSRDIVLGKSNYEMVADEKMVAKIKKELQVYIKKEESGTLTKEEYVKAAKLSDSISEVGHIGIKLNDNGLRSLVHEIEHAKQQITGKVKEGSDVLSENAKGTSQENYFTDPKEIAARLAEEKYISRYTTDNRATTEDKPNGEGVVTKSFDAKGNEIAAKGYKKLLTTNEVRAIRDIMQSKLEHIRETAKSTEEYGKEIDKLVTDITERSKGDKTVLSALRTELNKEMFGIAGAGGNYKEAYATLMDIRKTDPEMGALIDKFDSHIRKLDETLLATPDKNYQQPAFVKERQKSAAQSGEVTSQLPVGTGKMKTSKAYEHMAERLLALDPERFKDIKDGQPFYNVAKATEQVEKAADFIEKDPQKAFSVAMGYTNPPDGLRANDVSIALSDRALAEKNDALMAKVETAMSLRSTRQGQEIAALRGRGNDNSPHAFIQQVMSQRLNKLGKSSITDTIDMAKKAVGKKIVSVKERAVAKIDIATEKLQKQLRKQQAKIQSAQSLLDQLTCK